MRRLSATLLLGSLLLCGCTDDGGCNTPKSHALAAGQQVTVKVEVHDGDPTSGFFDLNAHFYQPPWPTPPEVGRRPPLLPGLADGTYDAVVTRATAGEELSATIAGRRLLLQGPLGCG